MARRGKTVVMALMVATAVAGCTKIVERRGYIPDSQALSEVEIGVDTQTSVASTLGTPSTIAPFEMQGQRAWYYISTTTERRAFLDPKPVERTILAVYFNTDNKVADIRRYGLEDGRIVDFESRETPTTGKELTILGQLFGNLGRFNSGGQGSGGPTGPGAPTPGGSIPR